MRNTTPKEANIYIKNEDGSRGPLLVSRYTRIVVGQRGAYLEIPPKTLGKALIEPEPGQEWRFMPQYRDPHKGCFYAWYRTKHAHRKLYYQYRKVNYADYLIGYWYISIDDVSYDGELYKEISDHPL